MWFVGVLFGLLVATPAMADSFWHHNGSEVALDSDGGGTRRITYIKPKPGLPVAVGTLLFDGRAHGNQYSGTAYVFSSRCRVVLPYQVRGNVSTSQRKITLYGRAPANLDGNCNVVGYRDDVLEFHFTGCGCECGEEPELAAIYPPRRNYAEGTQTGYSCPYLYAWQEAKESWREYGKVIREARGANRAMTDTVTLDQLHLRFRLAEEEPEESFIKSITLLLLLKDGSRVSLNPTYQGIVSRARSQIHVPAYGRVEFSFRLPPAVRREDVSQASLAITGYYRDLPYCALPRKMTIN